MQTERYNRKFFGFVGKSHITPIKWWTALSLKNYVVCAVKNIPCSGITYCLICAKKTKREKSNESKRRGRERNRRVCIELSAKNDRLKMDRDICFSQFGGYKWKVWIWS